MRTLIIMMFALAASFAVSAQQTKHRFWDGDQVATQKPAQIQDQAQPAPTGGWRRLNNTENSVVAHNRTLAQRTEVRMQEEPDTQPTQPETLGSDNERKVMPMCPTAEDRSLEKQTDPRFNKVHSDIVDVATRGKNLTVNVSNGTKFRLKYVLAPEGAPLRNLCPDEFGVIRIPKSVFTSKKGETLQLMAVDEKGGRHWSEPYLVGRKSTSVIWDVGGDNDADGPISYWAQQIAADANKHGYNPELENQRREAMQRAGVPGRVASETGQWDEYGFPGAAVPGYGQIYSQPGYSNGGVYNTGVAYAGGAAYSGNVAVMVAPGVPTDRYGQPLRDGWGRPFGWDQGGPGTSYVPNSCGSIFAPATWPYCNRPVYGYGGGYGGYGYGRPIRRGIHGGISARIGIGF